MDRYRERDYGRPRVKFEFDDDEGNLDWKNNQADDVEDIYERRLVREQSENKNSREKERIHVKKIIDAKRDRELEKLEEGRRKKEREREREIKENKPKPNVNVKEKVNHFARLDLVKARAKQEKMMEMDMNEERKESVKEKPGLLYTEEDIIADNFIKSSFNIQLYLIKWLRAYPRAAKPGPDEDTYSIFTSAINYINKHGSPRNFIIMLGDKISDKVHNWKLIADFMYSILDMKVMNQEEILSIFEKYENKGLQPYVLILFIEKFIAQGTTSKEFNNFYSTWFNNYSDELLKMYTASGDILKEVLSEKLRLFIDASFEDKNVDMLYLDDDLKNLVAFSITNDKAGSGGQGSIYFPRDGSNYIIKFSNCQENPLGSKNCQMLSQGDMYKTPYSVDKNSISTPDTISEAIIGYLLHTETSKYTPVYVPTYGAAWDKEDGTSISISPKMENGIWEKMVNTGEDFIYCLTYILHALDVAQKTCNFNHKDLHLGNIMHENIDNSSVELQYIENGELKKIFIESRGWRPKIIDYGLATLEKDNVVYSGGYVKRDIRPIGLSHCIDYLTFLGCVLNPYFTAYGRQSDFKNNVLRMKEVVLGSEKLLELANRSGFRGTEDNENLAISFWIMSFFCNDFDPRLSVRELVYKLSSVWTYNYYRPDFNNMYLNSSQFRTPGEALNIMIPQLAELGILDRENKMDFNINYNKFDIYNPLFIHRHNNARAIKENDTIELKARNGDLIVRYESVINEGGRYKTKYNVSDNILSMDLPQYYHIAQINLRNMSKGGYEFISDCCGISVTQYLEMKDKYGIVINGTFFDILNSNLPIGYYKDAKINGITFKDIPKDYRNFYGYMAIGKDSIAFGPIEESDKLIKSGEIDNYMYLVQSGPVLIDRKNNILFTEDMYNIRNPNIPGNPLLFTCVTEMDAGIRTNKKEKLLNILERKFPSRARAYGYIEKGTYYNCDSIAAGELSHGSNLNQRTVIAINEKEGYLYFIYIEGRKQRGSGLDFASIAHDLLKMDDNISFAMNLDGGGSSNMVMRLPGDDGGNVILSNTSNVSPYPSGNLLAIVNKN